jgi:hypothetical protein
LLSVVLLMALKAGTHPARTAHANNLPIGSIRYTHLSIFILLGFVLIGTRFLIAEGHTPLRQTRLLGGDGGLRGVDQPYSIDFGHRWTLLGLDDLPGQIAGDEALEAVLYWRVGDAQGRDYSASIALVDATGRQWTEVGTRSPRWHRTPPPVHSWPAEGYAITAYLADLVSGTPPGDYRAVLTAFDKETPGMPLTAYTPEGVALGPSLDLGNVRVTRPSKPVGRGDLSVGTRQGAQLGPLVLEGANLDRSQAAPGDPMMVTLFWRVPDGAAGGSLPDLRAHLALVDGGGVEVMGWELPPVRSDWLTTLWRPGDLWRGQHLLRLPGGLEGGDYAWQLQLFDAADRQAPLTVVPIVLGELQVDAPQREWQAPPLELALDADLGGEVRLLGANLEPVTAEAPTLQAGEILTVTLAWQGLQEMDTSYRVFLHLQRPDGSLLAQSDGEPAGWRRPTTGWAPGEVVLDQRSLEIPAEAVAGRYTLMTGLYDLGSGQRLALPDGTTAVLLSPVTIETP